METSKRYLILFSVIITLFFTTCKEKEADNPFDADCPKELFTPANFESEMSGASVKLSWTQENLNINGFVINRSENEGAAAEVARVDEAATTWTDTKVAGGAKYDYTLYAYAGANLSNPLTTSITTPALNPTVTTSAASDVTSNSAVLGGNVTSNGGATVTARGVCYGTTRNPTTSGTKMASGSGNGIFSGTISNLAANTTYYARAYATNSYGTAYGEEISFTTTQILLPTVTTATATSITATSAVLGGNVTSDGNSTVTEKGVCYSLTVNPTIANTKVPIGSGTGAFSKPITGLTAGTTYYVKAYAINSKGTAYGEQIVFTTAQALLATVVTSEASSVSATSAVLGGNVTGDGNAEVTENGICYATSGNPTTSNTKVSIGTGTGTFSKTVTGLAAGTKYYVRAYAVNSKGTAYGSQISFTTTQSSVATVTTASATNVASASVVLGGNVTSDGNATVTERGVCYATAQNPTTSNSKLAMGSGTGTFSNTVTGLTTNTTYYARAYAINNKGTAYGNQVSFTTTAGEVILASLSTTAATNITTTTAVLGGNVTDAGGGTVTERGVCYKLERYYDSPTIDNTKVVVGSGTGLFSTTVSGLAPNTEYEVRAYAINSKGVAYGPEITFTTSGNLPVVQTKEMSNVLETSAVAGGIVSSDEGASVTERGVCYGTASNPTIYDKKNTNGSGTGGFNVSLNSLIPNTTYYVRAYATNNNGTAYGENKTFKTADAYYAGFESGWPTGWTGNWSISPDSPYEGFYCLKSTAGGQTVELARAITNASGGQISFYHKSYGTRFYIDSVLKETIGHEGSWTIHSYSIPAGNHTFKWINDSSSGTAYIDYVICPK